MSNDWLNDIKDAETDDDGDDDGGASLFEDNFRQMVEKEEIESLNVQTIRNKIDKIDDADLIGKADDIDTRTTAHDVYEQRLDDLTADTESEDEPDSDTAAEEDDEPEPDEVDEQEESEPAQEVTVEDAEETVEKGEDPDAAESDESGSDDEDDQSPPDDDEPAEDDDTTPDESDSDLPEVDITTMAPDAVRREDAGQSIDRRTMLVWGQEGTGKTHVAHTAPEPVVVIDTEGKADELAKKFDKEIYYFKPDGYQDATSALEQGLDILDAYFEEGVRGTLVVDAITVMWDWAQQDYQELAYPSAEGPDDVDFKSALEGENDWQQIKRRHNQDFRDRIVDSPYHAVFTASQKKDYSGVFGDGEANFAPDGEKRNQYVVKDVVRLRTNDEGKTVADLHKASQTRYSFVGLEWPEWDSMYEAIAQISEAEQAPEPVDVSRWDFEVVEGQPVTDEDGDDDE